MPYGPGLWKMTSQFQDETQKSIVGNNFESGFMRFGILPRLFAIQTTTFAFAHRKHHMICYIYMFILRVQCTFCMVNVSKVEPP